MNFLDEAQWVAVDTETTGLNPYKHELIEIGAVRFSLKGLAERFQVLIKPRGKFDPRARAVNLISNEELEKSGIPLQEALPKFFDFIQEDSLVFHNAPFDLSFIVTAANTIGYPLPANTYYDNLHLSRVHFSERKSHALAALRGIFNIETGQAHRALADAEATALIFLASLKEKGQQITSKKKFQKFMKISRRLDRFKVRLPKNFEEIQKYFDRRIKTGELFKVQYSDKEGRQHLHLVKAKELMVFNQNIFLKVEVQTENREILVPIAQSIFFDNEIGTIQFLSTAR